jgi:hypothetical protein
MSKIKKAVKAVKRNLGKDAFKRANETIRKAQEDVRRGN